MRLPRYRFGEFELDPASRELSRFGERVALPPKSFECLTYLIANRERAVGRDELISAVWGRVEVSDTVVAQTLLRARKGLGDTGNLQAMIRTVPRFGYQWVAPVEEVAEPVDADGAGDERQAMDGATSPSPAMEVQTADDADADMARPAVVPASRSRHWLVAAVVLLVALLASTAIWWTRRAPDTANAPVDDTVLVLPVAVEPTSNENAWVRLGAMEYLAGRLRRAGLKVLPSDQTLHLSVPFGDDLDAAALARLQAASGARWVVLPRAEQDARGWQVSLTVRTGDIEQVVQSGGTTPLAAAAAAGDSWLHRLGLSPSESDAERVPSALTERVQRVDAELLAGQLVAARELIEDAPAEQRRDPRLQVREGQLEYRAGRIDEAAKIFSAILEATPAVSPGIRAKALMGQGAISIRRRAAEDAEARYTSALEILDDAGEQRIDDPALLGNAYNGRGVARVIQGKMDEAIRDMGLARIAMQRSGDFVEAAMVGGNLGNIEFRRGHYPQALQEFDRAIEVFERFDVNDYLAAVLAAKAESQLNLVQPTAAADTVARAVDRVEGLEDRFLVSRVRDVQARILLANGRLDDAEAAIGQFQAMRDGSDDATVRMLRMRLLMAKGDIAGAGALARALPPPDDSPNAEAALVAVQAALRNRDDATARAWSTRLGHEDAYSALGRPDDPTAWSIVQALLARHEGRTDEAADAGASAVASAERDGSPEERVQAGLLQVRLLLDAGKRDGAIAVVGDLDSFARADYRVAWTAMTLYRALDDATMAKQAEAHVEAIRGERDIEVEPIL